MKVPIKLASSEELEKRFRMGLVSLHKYVPYTNVRYLGIIFRLAFFSVVCLSISLFLIEKLFVEQAIKLNQADAAVIKQAPKDIPLLKVFMRFASSSSKYRSVVSRELIVGLESLNRSLEQMDVHIPNTLDARFFVPKQGAIVLYRRNSEIPAQVVRPIPDFAEAE